MQIILPGDIIVKVNGEGTIGKLHHVNIWSTDL